MTRINDFLVEFDSLLSTLDLITYNTVICGDFNLWMDDSSLPSVDRINNLLASYNLKNNITTATSSTGHALDLVIDDQEGRLQNINIESRCTFSPVHMMITYNLGYESQKYRKVIRYREKRDFSPETFLEHIEQSISMNLNEPCNHVNGIIGSNCVDCLVDRSTAAVRDEYNRVCPMREKVITVIDMNPWYNGELAMLKRDKRRAEKAWIRTGSEVHKDEFIRRKRLYLKNVRIRKAIYYKNKIDNAGTNMRKIYNVLNTITGQGLKTVLPDRQSDQTLANSFMDFFSSKIEAIANELSSREGVNHDTGELFISEENKLKKIQ